MKMLIVFVLTRSRVCAGTCVCVCVRLCVLRKTMKCVLNKREKQPDRKRVIFDTHELA